MVDVLSNIDKKLIFERFDALNVLQSKHENAIIPLWRHDHLELPITWHNANLSWWEWVVESGWAAEEGWDVCLKALQILQLKILQKYCWDGKHYCASLKSFQSGLILWLSQQFWIRIICEDDGWQTGFTFTIYYGICLTSINLKIQQ